MPKVSVIIPVWNVEKYLQKCLKSVVTQTLDDIEIIIINDGSPDGSQKIIDDFSRDYSNIKAFKIINGGLGNARNYGLKNATGKYVTFIDSDDFVEPNYLKLLYEKAEKHDSDIVCFSSYYLYFGNLKIKSPYLYLPKTEKSKKKYIVLTLAFACNRLYKREMFENINFAENRLLFEDIPVTVTLLAKAKKINYIRKSLYNYRVRSTSILGIERKKISLKSLDIFQILLELRENFIKENLYDKYYEELEGITILYVHRRFIFTSLPSDKREKIINLYLNFLDINYPKWNKNRYYLNGFDRQIIVKSSILFKTIKYSSRKKRPYTNNKDLMKALKKVIKNR